VLIREELKSSYQSVNEIFVSGQDGYWSNLSQEENQALISALPEMTAKEAIEKHHPTLQKVIFSPKRAGGLGLLSYQGKNAQWIMAVCGGR
jgi:hypothetical protein